MNDEPRVNPELKGPLAARMMLSWKATDMGQSTILICGKGDWCRVQRSTKGGVRRSSHPALLPNSRAEMRPISPTETSSSPDTTAASCVCLLFVFCFFVENGHHFIRASSPPRPPTSPATHRVVETDEEAHGDAGQEQAPDNLGHEDDGHGRQPDRRRQHRNDNADNHVGPE